MGASKVMLPGGDMTRGSVKEYAEAVRAPKGPRLDILRCHGV